MTLKEIEDFVKQKDAMIELARDTLALRKIAGVAEITDIPFSTVAALRAGRTKMSIDYAILILSAIAIENNE